MATAVVLQVASSDLEGLVGFIFSPLSLKINYSAEEIGMRLKWIFTSTTHVSLIACSGAMVVVLNKHPLPIGQKKEKSLGSSTKKYGHSINLYRCSE